MTIHGKTGVEVGDMAANVDPNSRVDVFI